MWWLWLTLSLAQEPSTPTPAERAEVKLAAVLAGMEELGWREVERDERGVRLRPEHSGRLEVLLTPEGEVRMPGAPRQQAEIIAEIGFDPFSATDNVRGVESPAPLRRLSPDGRALWVLHANLHQELLAWRQAAILARREPVKPAPSADQVPESEASQTE